MKTSYMITDADRLLTRRFAAILGVAAVMLWTLSSALAAPITVDGDPFTLVATGPGTAQLFGLTSDAQGRVYSGNNSNNTTGIPVQRFDPTLFSNSPVLLQNFGPAVGDADGLTFGGGFIYVADRDEGLRRIAVADETHTIFVAGAAINGTGSPIVSRPQDGNIFVGFGTTVPGSPGAKRIDEYDATGGFVQTFTTTAETETMTFDAASGLIYYAPFGMEVRSLNPRTGVDTLVGNSSGFIDGGLALDPQTGLLFVGTANGVNSGLVETFDPKTGTRSLFASGFNGTLGILREPVSGDLYVLETNQLYRLESRFVFPQVQFSAATYSVGEDAGLAVLTVTRTGDTTGSTVVHYATSSGSATSGADFADTSGDLTFAPSETSKTFSVPITDDSTVEGDETFTAMLSLPPTGAKTGVIGSPSTATVTIVDNDAAPTPTPAQLLNISTRLRVQTGDNVLIGGIIITGNEPKKVIFRAIGPSMTSGGAPVPGSLVDPTLELHDGNGNLMTSNDNWKDSPQRAEIEASGLAPSDDKESAILRTLTPGNYTAIVRGKDESTGIALVEAFDLNQDADSLLANISTRGKVETANNVIIGGFIEGNHTASTMILVRAIGPSLQGKVPDALEDPVLELLDSNGALMATNDNWKGAPERAEIEATGIPPSHDLESAILRLLPPAAYTAIVRGKGGATGNGLVEIYNIR